MQRVATVVADFVVAIAEESIDGAYEALNSYEKLIERQKPWKELKKTYVDVDKFRKELSLEKALLTADIRMDIMDGLDAQFHASHRIYEWAAVTAVHLKLYIKLFDEYDAKKSKTQNQILNGVLDKLTVQINQALTKLNDSALSYQSASDKLKTLLDDLPNDKSTMKRFYDHLYKILVNATDSIRIAVQKLRKKIKRILELKKQNQQSTQYVNLNDRKDLIIRIVRAAQELMAKCENYQTKHTNKIDLF